MAVENQPDLFGRSIYQTKKSPTSLEDLCLKVIFEQAKKVLQLPNGEFCAKIEEYKQFLTKSLHAVARQDLLDGFLPDFSEWLFPCTSSQLRLRCRLHKECMLMWDKSHKVLQMLLNSDTNHLRLDLKKIQTEDTKEVITQLKRTLRDSEVKCHLSELILRGGTSAFDHLIYQIEDLCIDFVRFAPKLKVLHLPLASDRAFDILAHHSSLQQLKVDRMVNFSSLGLRRLCFERSKTRNNLKVLELSTIAPCRGFDKHDLAWFLESMNLLLFNLNDQNRPLICQEPRVPFYTIDSSVYTSVALCVIDRMLSQIRGTLPHLSHLKIVDKTLDPRWLLENNICPTSLTIDWQEELCDDAYRYFGREWFSQMLRTNEWVDFAKNITGEFHLVLPSTRMRNAYSLGGEDCDILFKSLPNVNNVVIEGAGKTEEFLSLEKILENCPRLKSLKVIGCDIDTFNVNPTDAYPYLTAFHFIKSESTSTTGLCEFIYKTMPNLVSFEIISVLNLAIMLL